MGFLGDLASALQQAAPTYQESISLLPKYRGMSNQELVNEWQKYKNSGYDNVNRMAINTVLKERGLK